MLVTPETFEMHLRQAKKHFDIIQLSEWLALHRSGQPLPHKACAITFDDGWADNHEFGLPILKTENLPATMFLVSDRIGTDFHFWPNIVAALIKKGRLQDLNNNRLFSLAYSKTSGDIFAQDYIGQYVWHLKNQFTDQMVFQALADINWKQLIEAELPASILSHQQLADLMDSNLFEFGSHTCTHSRLNETLTEEELIFEIKSSKETLSAYGAKFNNLFCYPSGDFDPRALKLVEDNYVGAVTTQQGIVDARNFRAHKLPRIRIHDDITNTPTKFGARISGF